MTRLDIIRAIMGGAGISQMAAIKALREHDESVRAQLREETGRREDIAKHALQGILCNGRLVTPEEIVRQALQHADILIAEIDK
ncbi:hypothetical protein [Paraburkholderia sp. BL21I4N1]|uniref:hypothetical protein n=1 Tax=Paraburkholderia sp. BL21I4N1 TaxID=1938801 RepID=UPI000CFC69F0|nr:hypothetical protein [Paraburkholderia sp. BL21I4N1]PQV51842.1 hypothetical protein B0G83_10451 [Paraburkholderia sp. BL21I4N1]